MPFMDPRLQNITSECPVCSGKEIPTGRTETRDTDQIYVEFQCQDCKSVGWEWSLETQTLLGRR